MRALAAWVMKGPREATLVAAIGACVPPIDELGALSMVSSIISAAVLALVVLRHGLNRALPVVAVALIAAAFGAVYAGSPAVIFPLLLSIFMATLLKTLPLMSVVVAALVPAVLLVLGFDQVHSLWTETDQQTLLSSLEGMLKQQLGEQSSAVMSEVSPLVRPIMLGALAAGLMMQACLALFVGRHWQAMLYNPGGFQREFHALILPKWLVLTTLLLLFTWSKIHPLMGVLLPGLYWLCLVAGLALVHGAIGQSSADSAQTGNRSETMRSWLLLVIFYVSMWLLLPVLSLLLISMAWMDSFFNFRKRWNDTAS